MQQVVDLQRGEASEELGVELPAISPDPVEARREEGDSYGVTVPALSDPGNAVWLRYGTPGWMMASEPGHTFFLLDGDGTIAWLRDYGALEHGGAMYVPPDQLVPLIEEHL